MQRLKEVRRRMLALTAGDKDECGQNLMPRIFELACMLDEAINELEQVSDPFSYGEALPALSIERPGRYDWDE